MKSTLKSSLLALVTIMLCACSQPNSNEGTNISAAKVDSVVKEFASTAPDAALAERGIRQCARLWRTQDGDEAEFESFVKENLETTAEAKQNLFEHLQAAFEVLYGNSNDATIRLQRPTVIAGNDPHNVDYIFSSYNAFSHMTEDLYENKIAFITVLNFPFYTLEEKNELGREWSRLEWGYARMGDIFKSRVPSEVNRKFAEVQAAGEAYIADYNIMMDHVLTEEGERIFPEGMCLLSHWNLRDELKADYADVPNANLKQEMIFKVMEHIVLQDIPLCVINSTEYDWKPYSNTVWKDGKQVDAEPENTRRYQYILDYFHAEQQMDKWSEMPTGIARNFEGSMEVPAEEIENLFVSLISSDEIKATSKVIAERLGRDLRPYDIWYDGFKSRSAISEDVLTAQTKALYPDAEAFHKQMPSMLRRLGFTAEDAEYIADKIMVEGARGSGHAWSAASRWQPSLLRTRLVDGGMDYKGYNIAVHEFGHNVEQTFDLYYVDNYMMNGIPNSALTETMAFIFQRRDLKLLGYDTKIDDNVTLDIFWGCYEVMGVALVDMYLWRWLYENPSANAEQLRDACVSIARDVWNKYYEPVLGEKDTPLLAIYSHMVNFPMYLPNYPYGHLVEYQLEAHLAQFAEPSAFAAELKRMYTRGRLTPKIWMEGATGEDVSVEPLLAAVNNILQKMVDKN